MEWETSDYETKHKTSEWSDIATFGKNSTQIIPKELRATKHPLSPTCTLSLRMTVSGITLSLYRIPPSPFGKQTFII